MIMRCICLGLGFESLVESVLGTVCVICSGSVLLSVSECIWNRIGSKISYVLGWCFELGIVWIRILARSVSVLVLDMFMYFCLVRFWVKSSCVFGLCLVSE